MRLLNVSVVYPPAPRHGGTPITSHEAAKAVAALGHEVLSIATGDAKRDGTPVVDNHTIYDGMPAIYCSRLPCPLPFFSPSLGREVAEHLPDFDVASIRSSWTLVGPMASARCRERHTPYIGYPEGNLDPWALRRSFLRKRAFWRLFDRDYFRGASAIVALTTSEADSIRRMGLSNRVEVIPNGVRLEDLDGAMARRDLDSVFPSLHGRRVVLFMGRLHPKKGLPLLLGAFRRVRDEVTDAVLAVAGADETGHLREVRARVRALGLTEDVAFLGHVSGETKKTLLHHAEAFVLPSYSEGLPVAVLEAMGCGTPVVVSEQCHLPEVREVGAGIVTDLSEEAVGLAIRALLRDDEMRRQMGMSARRLVVERFTWGRVGRMTAALASEVAAG